jgi:hypothetical protein
MEVVSFTRRPHYPFDTNMDVPQNLPQQGVVK